MANIRVARRSGSVLRGGRMRRESLWFGGVDQSTTTSGASSAVALTSLNAAALSLRPFTIIRTRGIIRIQSDQAAAAEVQGAAWGACVVSDQSLAIGVTALPTPVTDSGSDLWFGYEWIMSNATDLTDLAIGGVSKEIDSRAMRKVEDGQDVITVMESAVNTNGLTLRSFSWFLVKLH